MNTHLHRRKSELESYRPEPTLDGAALDRFWSAELARHAERPLGIVRERAESPFAAVAIDRLTYFGFDDTPIHGWFLVPQSRAAGERLPCIVTYPGYTGDRGLPERYAHWLLLGFAVLAVDARGQGGETGSRLRFDAGAAKGWVSLGIADKSSSYYMALAVDAVRAVEAAAQQAEADPDRLAVVGASQGGGLSLLAAALHPGVAAVVADIPNMCHMDYGLLNSTGSLTELAQYVSRYPDRLDIVLDSLAHFDLLNLAHRIAVPVLMSVGWKDTVCLPETVYAAYNRIGSPKRIVDYPFIGHEVKEDQVREAIVFLRETLLR